MLRDVRASGFKVKRYYSEILLGPYIEIEIDYSPGVVLPNPKPQPYQYRGKPRVLKDALTCFSSESIKRYVESRLDREKVTFDIILGAMPLYSNSNFEGDVVLIDERSNVGPKNTYISSYYRPKYVVDRVKQTVREKNLEGWKIFIPVTSRGIGALIFKGQNQKTHARVTQ